ncbi:MAG TPA: hypothetical protein VH540_24890 [Ktedonobacterales bacterium]
MRRLVQLSGVSLMTALLVALLMVSIAGASASQATSDSGHFLTATLTPVLGSTDATIQGVAPGGLPWVLTSGHVNLSTGGLLEASVDGLLLAPGTPNGLAGTRGPIAQVFASLVCANGPIVNSDPVTFTTEGDAHFHQVLTLPNRCLAPIVLIRGNVGAGPWLAASGF